MAQGLPWWFSGWESISQCRGYKFNPWFRKISNAAGQLSSSTTTTEPTFPRACAPQQEKPLQWETHTQLESSPHPNPARLLQLKKVHAQKWRPSTAHLLPKKDMARPQMTCIFKWELYSQSNGTRWYKISHK